MTPAQNANNGHRFAKTLVALMLALVAALYAAGYFFLWSLKLPPHEATPLTPIRYWYYYGHRPEVRTRLAWSTAAGFGAVGLIGLPFLLPRRRSLHGDARFAKPREIRAAGLLAEKGIILGQWKGRYLTLGGQQGVMVAAPPRSGKGTGVVVPNLLNWSGSVVCLDIKQENWRITAGWRAKHGQQVHLFDPFSPQGRTARWNPLSYVSSNPHLRIDDLQRIALMLCGEVPGSDPFWVKSARSLFVGIALYLFERRDHEREENARRAAYERIAEIPVTIGEVLRQAMATDEEGFEQHWKRIIQGWHDMGKPLSPACVALIMDVVKLAAQTSSSVRKTFTSQLDLWLNPLLDLATSGDDFDLRDLRKKPISIYLGITPRDLERLQGVMNLFFQQAIGEQTVELPEYNRDLKYQLLVLLDEFTALGRIPILLNSMAFIPGYNVRTLMVIQTPAQLYEVYGQHGARVMLKALAARVVYAPKDVEDAREISEELGYTTVKTKTFSRPAFGSARGNSVNVSEQRRALMLPQEVKEMGREKEIIFYEGVRPIMATKIRYYLDERFKSRLLPAPAVPAHDAAIVPRSRADDGFAAWLARVRRLAERGAEKFEAVAEPVTDVVSERPMASEAGEFSLNFDDVVIPDGRALTPEELKREVKRVVEDLD
jgi:type IV secretion system protein VirD4